MITPVKKTKEQEDSEALVNATKNTASQAMRSAKDALTTGFKRNPIKTTPRAVKATQSNTQSTQDVVEGMMGVKKPTKPGDPLYFENRK